jgi:hypothetical protein
VLKEETTWSKIIPMTKVHKPREQFSCGPSKNLEGGFKFMALNTGEKAVWQNLEVSPIPDLVIACIKALGYNQL